MSDELVAAVYAELRALAHRWLDRERRGQTLDATALVHEAYLRLAGGGDPQWNDRGHFFGAAAQAMRRILVERARAKACLKRGGGREKVELSEVATLGGAREDDVLAIDEALERLSARDERKARVVLLRYFAGLELTEVAAVLGVSLATVKNDWAFARAWLHRELSGGAATERA
jgi:RNA polymerase sigma factor (TIGR02999 family)